MKNRILLIFGIAFLVQVGLLMLIWGSPGQVLQRSLTPTPTASPLPPPPTAIRPTRIPTLIPVSMGAPTEVVRQANYGTGQCPVAALDLIGAWVMTGKPDAAKLFEFTGTDGKTCLGAFDKDVQPLFDQPNIWYAGALACTACHGANVKLSSANMSLVNYSSILAGSRRADSANQGNDILGNETSWAQSKLYTMLFTRQMPIGRPYDAPEKGPVVRVGAKK